jgi:lactaldehyde dehydrogenase
MPCLHDAVEAICFTGSTSVGEYLADNNGIKKMKLELGGNDPTVVWEDSNIEKAATRAVGGACFNAGQVCNCIERVHAQDSIEDEFVDAAVEATKSLKGCIPFDQYNKV